MSASRLAIGPKCFQESSISLHENQKLHFTGTPLSSIKLNLISQLNNPDTSPEGNSELNYFKRSKTSVLNASSHKSKPETTKNWKKILLTGKFLYHIKKRLSRTVLAKLKEFHYILLQEDYDENLWQNKLNRFTIKINFTNFLILITWLLNKMKIPLINPNNKLKVIWDIVIMCITLLHFYIIIFMLAFESEMHQELDIYKKSLITYQQWLLFLTILIPIDIFHKMNSGYFDNGKIVKDRIKIIKNYVKTHFPWDFASYLTFIIDFAIRESDERSQDFSIPAQLFKILFFLRLPILQNLIENVEETINFNDKIEAFISIFKLFVKMLFFAHIAACLWYVLGNLNSDNWITCKSLTEKSLIYKYISSLYWAITTICTVGYGDITPTNEIEYAFAMIVMVLGSMFFGYSITYIGKIFDKMQREEISKKENLHILKKLLKKNKIDFETQIQIRKYMNFLWENSKKDTLKKEEEIFQNLSVNLQENVLSQTNGKFLFSKPMFSNNFSREFLTRVLFLMKPVNFDPDSIIYQKSQRDKLGIYIMVCGEVEFFDSNHDNSHHFLIGNSKDSDVFGEFEFFTGGERIISAKSVSYVRAFFIDLAEFLNELKNFPLDFEQYNLIKDSLILSKNSRYLFQNCPSCQETSHHFTNCPILEIPINKYLIFNKSNFSITQFRKPFERQHKTKQNALKFIQLNNSKAGIIAKEVEFMAKSDSFSKITFSSLSELESPQMKLEVSSPYINQNIKSMKKFRENDVFCNGESSYYIEEETIDNKVIGKANHPKFLNDVKENIGNVNKPEAYKEINTDKDMHVNKENLKKYSIKDVFTKGGTINKGFACNMETSFKENIKEKPLKVEIFDREATNQSSFKQEGTNKEGIGTCNSKEINNAYNNSKTIDTHTFDNKYTKEFKTVDVEKMKSTQIDERKNEEINQNELFLIIDFERMKLFTKYKPNGNFDNIINILNKTHYYKEKKRKIRKKISRLQKFLKRRTKKSINFSRKKSSVKLFN